MRRDGYAKHRALIILCVMLGLAGCTTSRVQCESPTVPPELTEPLRPLTPPEGSNCAELLGNYTENLGTCAEWGARYRALVEAIGK